MPEINPYVGEFEGTERLPSMGEAWGAKPPHSMPTARNLNLELLARKELSDGELDDVSGGIPGGHTTGRMQT
jgi:hypothetical protein